LDKVIIVAELRDPIIGEETNKVEAYLQRYLVQRIIPWAIVCERGVEVRIERGTNKLS